jgi:aspartyl-tRNA(Asn)/glutamyl-tRNA(Gln) amidotransferase subunit C
MEINQETIAHLANLSNFALDAEQSSALESNLQDIIGYISQLDQLNTTGVEPTYQVFEMENVWRADEILPQDADRAELLALTKEVEDNQIKVPKVL